MCKKSAVHWCGDKSNEPRTLNVLVSWTVFLNWNFSVRCQREEIEMTQRGETNLVHDLPVRSVLVENNRDEMLV